MIAHYHFAQQVILRCQLLLAYQKLKENKIIEASRLLRAAKPFIEEKRELSLILDWHRMYLLYLPKFAQEYREFENTLLQLIWSGHSIKLKAVRYLPHKLKARMPLPDKDKDFCSIISITIGNQQYEDLKVWHYHLESNLDDVIAKEILISVYRITFLKKLHGKRLKTGSLKTIRTPLVRQPLLLCGSL